MMSQNVSTHDNAWSFKFVISLLAAIAIFYTPSVYAAVPDVGTMLKNFANDVPQLMKLITAFAYVFGMYLIVKGVAGLKAAGEARTQMSTHHDLKGPVILIGVGTLLLYLPTSVQVGLTTFWTAPNPYGYETPGDDQWNSLVQTTYLVVQLIGTIAFIRGLITLTHLGGQGSQPGTFSKGLTYIIAGVLCINMSDFLAAVEATLGITGISP
ncbi:MAG: hypothetical protein P4M12_10770 [Gammaproteobacteria bacterium]|nr:hypothetical protein [Gammaproteobacteria bacterium]